MKCIKMNDGSIKKMDDDKAVKLVADKQAAYCSKEMFKAAHGKGEAQTKAVDGSRNSSKKAKKANKKIV